jgi:tRNA pseudouridine38-40 synthase
MPPLAALLPGRHDLSGFACLRHDGSDTADPVRTIHAAAWTRSAAAGGEEWTFAIRGEGFLYKQVRGLVGAMVHVASGRSAPTDFHAQMAAGRGARPFANVAPALGLELEAVEYHPEPEWTSAPAR